MPNNLSIDDIHVVANEILNTAQGRTGATAPDMADFTTVAQTLLKMGYDPLATAISQVLSRTIFSIRPYNDLFSGLEKSQEKWGNHVRKLTAIEKPLETDERLRDSTGTAWADGMEADHYKIKKPEVLQTNFYGSQDYQQHITIWTDQLDTAFQNEGQFGEFLTMVMGELTNQMTQTREGLKRGCLVNLIGGTYLLGNIWHVLTDYNTETGGTFTAVTIMQPQNFTDFYRWFIAKLVTRMNFMRERTVLNHVSPFVGGVQKTILRHTPISLQHLYMNADFMNKAESIALSTTFHDDYLKKADVERVAFWQDIATPRAINTEVNYLAAGNATTDAAITRAAAQVDNVLGILFDDEAAGFNPYDQRMLTTPINAAGAYYNQYWHERGRWWNDNTENALVICLD